jgi:hypothetical protein
MFPFHPPENQQERIPLPPLPVLPVEGEPITTANVSVAIRNLHLKVATAAFQDDDDVAEEITATAVYTNELLNAYTLQTHGIGNQGVLAILKQICILF